MPDDDPRYPGTIPIPSDDELYPGTVALLDEVPTDPLREYIKKYVETEYHPTISGDLALSNFELRSMNFDEIRRRPREQIANLFMEAYQRRSSRPKPPLSKDERFVAINKAGRDSLYAAGFLLSLPPEERSEYMQEIGNAWKLQGPAGFKETWKRAAPTPAHLLPFLGGLLTLSAQQRLKQDAQDVVNDLKRPFLTEKDRRRKQNIVLATTIEIIRRQARGETFAGSVGAQLAPMLPFMGEILAGMGVAKGAMAGVRAGLTRLGAGPLVKTTGGLVAGGIALTPFTPGIGAQTYERIQTPEVGLGETGELTQTKEAAGPIEAAVKAVGSAVIENLSELAGRHIIRGLGKVIKRLPGGEMATRIGQQVQEAWMKITGKSGVVFAAQLKRIGYHGIFGEIGEERLADALRAVTGIEDYGVSGSDLNPLVVAKRLIATIPSLRQLAVEAVTFSIPGLPGLMISTTRQMRDAFISQPSRSNAEALGLGRTSEKDRITIGTALKAVQAEQDARKAAGKPMTDAESAKMLLEFLGSPARPAPAPVKEGLPGAGKAAEDIPPEAGSPPPEEGAVQTIINALTAKHPDLEVSEGPQTGVTIATIASGPMKGYAYPVLRINKKQIQARLQTISDRIRRNNPNATATEIADRQQAWIDATIQEELIHIQQHKTGATDSEVSDKWLAAKWDALPKKTRQLVRLVYDAKAEFEGDVKVTPELLYLEYDRMRQQQKQTGTLTEAELFGKDDPITVKLQDAMKQDRTTLIAPPTEAPPGPVGKEPPKTTPSKVEAPTAPPGPAAQAPGGVQAGSKQAKRPPGVPEKPAQKPAVGVKYERKMYRGEGGTLEQVYGAEKVASGAAHPVLGRGAYYAETQEDATLWGPNIKRADVRLENALVLDSDAKWFDLLKKAGTPHLSSVSEEGHAEPHRIPEMAEKLQTYLRGQGYDGVVVRIPGGADVNARQESVKRLRETFEHSQAVIFGKEAPPAEESGKTQPPAPSIAPKEAPPAEGTEEAVEEGTEEVHPVHAIIGYTTSDFQDDELPALAEFLEQLHGTPKEVALAIARYRTKSGNAFGFSAVPELSQAVVAGKGKELAAQVRANLAHRIKKAQFKASPEGKRRLRQVRLLGDLLYKRRNILRSIEKIPKTKPMIVSGFNLGTEPRSEAEIASDRALLTNQLAQVDRDIATLKLEVDRDIATLKLEEAPPAEESGKTQPPAPSAAPKEAPPAEGTEEAVEEGAPPQEAGAPASPGVPFTITRDARQRLFNLNYSKEQVDRLRPSDARTILAGKESLEALDWQSVADIEARVKGRAKVQKGTSKTRLIESILTPTKKPYVRLTPLEARKRNEEQQAKWDRQEEELDQARDAKIRESIAAAEARPLTPGGKPISAAEAGPQLPPMQAPLTPGGKPISPYDIIRKAAKALGVTFRTGHIAQRRAGGIYKNLPEVIRQERGFEADLAIFSHELAHHLDNNKRLTKPLSLELRRELKKLDYEPKKARTNEGFAEYLRHYLTEDDAATFAPKFHAFFTQTWLPAHPEVAQKLGALRQAINQWKAHGADARASAILARKAPGGILDKLGQAAYDIEKAMLNRFAGLKSYVQAVNAQRQARGLNPLPKGENPYWVAQVLGESGPAQGANAVEHGVFSMVDGRRLSEGIQEIFDKLNLQPGELEQFTKFIMARHALDVWQSGRRFALSQVESQHVYNLYKDRPGWLDAAKALTAWNKALIRMYAEVGGLSPEAEKLILESWPAYVPLKRMLDSTKLGGAAQGTAGTPVKHMSKTGSALPVIDPLASMIQSAGQFYAAANRLIVTRYIVKAGTDVGGMGAWLERIPTPKEAVSATLERLKDQLEAANIDLANADADLTAIVTIFQPIAYTGQEPIVTFYNKGKLETYQLHPYLYDATKRMEAYQLPLILALTLGTATKLKRLGAVELRPSFGLLFNPARDIPLAMIQTSGNMGKMFFRIIGNALLRVPWAKIQELRGKGAQADIYYRIARQYGAQLSQYVGQDLEQTYKKVEEVVNNADQRRLYNVVMSLKELTRFLLKIPGKALRAAQTVIGIAESAPRLSEMQAVFEKYGYTRAMLEAGVQPPLPAIIEALLGYRRVTTDFSQKGTVMQVVNRLEAFSNAKIQGFVQPLENLRENPVRFAVRGMLLLTIPTLFYWLKNKDKDWYQELLPWQRVGFWNFEVNGEVFRIPRPFEVGMFFSSTPEAFLDSLYREDPKRAQQLAGQLFPGWADMVSLTIPDAVLPALEVLANFDFRREREIVSEELERLEPQDQYYAWNTAAAKYLGAWMKMSPAKTDHLLYNYSGGLLSDLLRIPEEGTLRATGFGRLIKTPYRGESMDEFYRDTEAATRKYNSAKDRGEQVDPALTARKESLEHDARIMTEIRKFANKEPDPDKRAQWQKYATGLARIALGKPPLEAYPNFFSAPLPEPLKKVRDTALANMAERLAEARPQTLTPKEKREGLTIQKKQAVWRADIQEARKWLRDHATLDETRKTYAKFTTEHYKNLDVIQTRRQLFRTRWEKLPE